MGRTALGLVFVLHTLCSWGQGTELDSLWKAHADPSRSAHERAVVMHEIVYLLRTIDVDSSITLAQTMLEDARARQDTLIIALAHRDLGNAYILLRKGEPALEHLHGSVEHYDRLKGAAALRGSGAAWSSIGMTLKNLGRMDEAIDAYRRSMEKHRAAQDEEGMVYVHSGLGRIFEIQGRYDSALVRYGAAATMASRLDMPDMEGGGYGNMANVYAEMGRIGEAIDHAYRSLAVMERIGNKRGVATCLTTVSSLKNALGEEAEALELLDRAHRLYTEVGYRQGIMTSGTSLGAMLLARNEPEAAHAMLSNVLSLERDANARDIMGRTLRDMGRAEQQLGHMDQAALLFEEAITLARELQDAPGTAMSLAYMGQLRTALGRPGQAVSTCTEGLRIAESHRAMNEKRENCFCLYEAHKALGAGMEALRYHERYIVIRDSITSERSARELTQRDMLYAFSKQQLADSLRHLADLHVLDQARAEERLRADRNRDRALAAGGGGMLLVLGGMFWFRADRRRRQERFEREAAQLETQALRSQMNPHFIFNALNSINAYVQQNDQDSASTFLTKFARVMRSVLENSRHSEVSLAEDLDALRGYLELERMRMRGKFAFTITVAPDIDPEAVLVPPLVVQPFVENAIWHGMANKAGDGHINLSVERRGQQLVWVVEDDGVGRRTPKPSTDPAPPVVAGTPVKKTSLGTTITRARLDLVRKQHGGQAGFRYMDLPQGTRVEVEMPLITS